MFTDAAGRADSGYMAERLAWAATKRTLDIVVALLALIALAPVLAALGALIKLDTPGPVLFRQRRLGRDRTPFTMLKLRTMVEGASPEAHLRLIEELASRQPGPRTPELKKLTDDARVTRVGAVLRRWSLDELPQLVNVLAGDMSLVGPRPALDYELAFYEAADFARFGVRPGLSGLWQVSGRAQLGFREMLSLDAEYARNAGPLTDLRVLARTPAALVRKTA
jgi:lipopolysaccharide/colanic/teichoic acid biosynthesis glycosyltransferase